ESRKFELPPSTIVSPRSARPSRSWKTSSVIFPAGIIIQKARGASSWPFSSSREVAVRSSTFGSYVQTSWPPSRSRSVMPWPIRPRPIIPSCIRGPPISLASSRAHELMLLRLHAVEELGEGVDELLDALLLEHPHDVVVVDPRRGEVVEQLMRLVEPLLERVGDAPVVLEGLDRLLRHRVHGLGAGQLLGVHHVPVRRGSY